MSSQPNILLFLTDDHGAWANGCYGNREVQTPMLDRLAAEGTRFTRAFTPTPVCSPARACLLTGHTASQVGIHDWLQEAIPEVAERDWLDGERTLFDYFHDAGYYTGLCGKWHLGRSHLPPDGADYHFGLPGWQGVHNATYTYVCNGERVPLEGNKSAFITDHAIKFLDQVPDTQPFFLNVGYIATHSPYDQQSHDPAVTALYQDATFADIPPYVPHPWHRNEGLAGGDDNPDGWHDRYIGYYAAVTETDRNVARIVEKLEALGRVENTIIIYTSDHGCAIGHHGFWGKGNSTRPLNMYETSLQVPLIWYDPAGKSGQVIEDYVDHYDTFMTILERAGISLDDQQSFPGRSYTRLLAGEAVDWEQTRYGEYGDLRMIRTPEWKLVYRYPDGPHELFNLQDDPDERINLFDHPEYAHTAAMLKQKLDDFYDRYSVPEKSGLQVRAIPRHNGTAEAWRDGKREARGLQKYILTRSGKMVNKVRWGIIGTGNICKQFARGLQAVDDAEIVAVGSRAQDSADAFGDMFDVPDRYPTYEALAQAENVDAIYIGTPHPMHLENMLLSLNNGKAVLCEKPFAVNAGQAEQAISLARSKKLFLMEAMWSRFFPVMYRVRELLQQGVIGDVRMLDVDFGFRTAWNPQRRLLNPELAGGALLDVGVYPVSLASMVFGKPSRIASLPHIGETGVDEQFGVLFGYEQGQLAIIASAIRTRTVQEAVINGTEGRITISSAWWHPTKLVVEIFGQETREITMSQVGNGYNYQAEEVHRCLREGLLESDVMPLDETLEIVKTMDAIRSQWGLKYPMES